MAFCRKLCRWKSVSRELLKLRSLNMTTSASVREKVLENLKNNPFFDKYASKIARLREESPEEFWQRLEENENSKRKKRENRKREKERPYSTASETAKPELKSSPYTKTRKLSDVMKTELLRDKSNEEIKQLWLDYHRDKDAVVSVLSKDTYTQMSKRGLEFSTFLLPLPRSKGYEFILCQFIAHEIHFTPLIAYQTHKENAPECLTVTFYPDLEEERGIVLMRGEFDTDILNCQEAQCLINELQLYYCQNNEKRLNLLKKFTYNPAEFDHMDLIGELENLQL